MRKTFYAVIFSCISMIGCTQKESLNEYQLIPYPNQLEAKSGEFKLAPDCKFILPVDADSALQQLAHSFVGRLNAVSGLQLSVLAGTPSDKAISLVINPEIKEEGYILDVKSDKIVIEASQNSGFFFALQTMKQLLPVAIYGETPAVTEKWIVPNVKIEDQPRFGYRGMHLDVSRHFFDVDQVKRYIDMMSVYKMNTFHWHLTDDQGWRIEIKKHPALTKIGGMRKKTMIKKEWDNYDTTPYGGYYTQEEIKEVIAYAAERFITVIPEIDLPGHMMAALAAYPNLGCVGSDYEVSGQWGIRDDVLCVGKETTFQFIEDVLSEVIDLFPAPYIHIGGDECPKVRWEKCKTCQSKIKELGIKSDDKHKAEHYLQSYTIARVEKFVNSKGRKIIGWDEILEGGLAPNATVMSWRGIEGGIEAARQKHDVIMTPSSHLYFDYYQSSDTENEPFSIGGHIPVERVYSFDPIPEMLTEEERKHILGVQANLWTEYIPTREQLEYQMLPRAAALAEVQWTNPASKCWKRFLNTLPHETRVYDLMGYNYAKHIYEIKATYQVNTESRGVIATLVAAEDAPIYYTLDGSEPTEQSMRYTSPINIDQTCTLKAKVVRENMEIRTFVKEFKFNKATGHPAVFNTNPKDKYTYAGSTILTDGIRGDFNYANGSWLGYIDNPMDVTIHFHEPIELSSVKLGTLVQFGEYIFPPLKLSVYGANEQDDFVMLGKTSIPMAAATDKDGLKEFECSFETFKTKKLRVVANTTDSMPEWHGASGEKSFIFVDEIMVN